MEELHGAVREGAEYRLGFVKHPSRGGGKKLAYEIFRRLLDGQGENRDKAGVAE